MQTPAYIPPDMHAEREPTSIYYLAADSSFTCHHHPGKHHGDADDDDKPAAGQKLARLGTGALNQVTHKRGSGGGTRSALHNGGAPSRRSAYWLLRKHVNETLLGWVQSKFKVNGRKLLPNDQAVTRIMVSGCGSQAGRWCSRPKLG